MGFFDDIKSKIFGAPVTASVSGQAATPMPAATSAPTAAPEVAAQQQAAVDAGMAAANKVIADAVAQKQAAAKVDVEAVLDEAVAKSGQKLNWKTSIVDLMKALDLDSSLSARKELADELGYTGDKSDSTTMNIWLHKQVLAKLAANGGKVPETLLA
jgi:hypothetical protein